jgi:hypothetical protein
MGGSAIGDHEAGAGISPEERTNASDWLTAA